LNPAYEPTARSAGLEMDHLLLEVRIKQVRCQPSKGAPRRHPIPRIGD
jgi:hypothetical protein